MARKTVIALFCIISFSLAGEIQISANHFHANEKSGENVLSGNVLVKNDKDILRSSRLLIITDKKRKPLKYIASGRAYFEIVLDNKHYKGNADELSYDVNDDTYELKGKAFVEELTKKQKLYGDKIIINKQENAYTVFSDKKKPVKFTFELEEEK